VLAETASAPVPDRVTRRGSLPTSPVSAPSLHAGARQLLEGWIPPGGRSQVDLRDAYLDFLALHDDAMRRECSAGHLTASTLVFDEDGSHVLLTLHRKVGRWLQLGGHCEPGDRSLRAAASREAREESAIDGLVLTDQPVRLDRHAIKCRPDTLTDHLDVQFAAWAPPGSSACASAESLELRWWPVDRLPDVDGSVRALVEQSLELRR
jgi:8-oxo-dGTP pyrophosphatase MutT (NUDIX family)